MPLESPASDATIWSVTQELSTMILEASFSIIYDVHSKGITNDNGTTHFKKCKQLFESQHLLLLRDIWRLKF